MAVINGKTVPRQGEKSASRQPMDNTPLSPRQVGHILGVFYRGSYFLNKRDEETRRNISLRSGNLFGTVQKGKMPRL
jgi:hypothetical protein